MFGFNFHDLIFASMLVSMLLPFFVPQVRRYYRGCRGGGMHFRSYGSGRCSTRCWRSRCGGCS